MSTLLVFLLLMGFSICMVVGLVTVLQGLISGPLAMEDSADRGMLSDQSAEG